MTEKGQAAVDLVRHTFETPAERMMEMTVIGRNQSLYMSMMRAFSEMSKHILDELRGKDEKIEDLPLPADAWLTIYEKYQRSVGGLLFKKALDLSQSQIESDIKEPEEFKDVDEF